MIERRRHLELVRAATPEAQLQVAWLEVPLTTVAERLAKREVGSALDWHVSRAAEIARSAASHDLFDFVVARWT